MLHALYCTLECLIVRNGCLHAVAPFPTSMGAARSKCVHDLIEYSGDASSGLLRMTDPFFARRRALLICCA